MDQHARFALNVSGDLPLPPHITPCGITGVEMTTIHRESGAAAEVRAVGERVAEASPCATRVVAPRSGRARSKAKRKNRAVWPRGSGQESAGIGD